MTGTPLKKEFILTCKQGEHLQQVCEVEHFVDTQCPEGAGGPQWGGRALMPGPGGFSAVLRGLTWMRAV